MFQKQIIRRKLSATYLSVFDSSMVQYANQNILTWSKTIQYYTTTKDQRLHTTILDEMVEKKWHDPTIKTRKVPCYHS